MHELIALGVGPPLGISAEHSLGIDDLVAAVEERLAENDPGEDEGDPAKDEGIKVALVGRTAARWGIASILILFAAELAGRRLPTLLSVIYMGLWAGVLVVYALAAGEGPSAPDPSAQSFFSITFFLLKTGPVLAVAGSLFVSAAKVKDSGERRSLRSVAGTYLAGFFLFRSVSAGDSISQELEFQSSSLRLLQLRA